MAMFGVPSLNKYCILSRIFRPTREAFKFFSGTKFKSENTTTHLTMKAIAILGAIAVAVLFFFAVIFALAASVQATTARLATSSILFIIGLAIMVGIYYTTRKPKTVIQRLEVSGQMAVAQIKCPNCGGSINADQIKINAGVPYVKCPYCGTTFKVTEEPKW
jgi:predicted Zn finger-like uncharacterized protein